MIFRRCYKFTSCYIDPGAWPWGFYNAIPKDTVSLFRYARPVTLLTIAKEGRTEDASLYEIDVSSLQFVLSGKEGQMSRGNTDTGDSGGGVG